jgi:hypothetical protein
LLLLFQKLDRIGRSPLDGNAIAADVDPRIQMGASPAIEDPPAPCDTIGTGILSYLYAVILWFFHAERYNPRRGGDKARNCHEPVILRD